MRLTRSQIDVLTCIYRVLESNSVARTTELASRLGLSKARIVQIIKELARMGLVSYSRYKGTVLTDRGRKIAVDIIKKHRLIELFLVEKLGVDVVKAHELAHELEHSLTGMFDELEKKYSEEARCPHGNPINPERETSDLMLIDLNEGCSGTVSRVTNESIDFLKTLISNSIWLGKSIRVIFKTDKLITLDIDGKILMIPAAAGRYIYVKVNKDGN